MKNIYEPSKVLELGKAKEIILGHKPHCIDADAFLGLFFSHWPIVDDIDESDE